MHHFCCSNIYIATIYMSKSETIRNQLLVINQLIKNWKHQLINQLFSESVQHQYRVGLGNISILSPHCNIIQHVISISQTFSHFNSITCAIYRRVLPNNAQHYCSSYSVLIKIVPTTSQLASIEIHKQRSFSTQSYCSF